LHGKALADVGDLVRAEEILSGVIASQPPSNVAARTHYQLGLIYRKMGRAEDAREHLRLFQQLQEELLAEENR
jgi:tetratricopeptide (TPR) repeat protein